MRMRVLMLVKSGVTDDSRIRREASALADAGYDVTVIGDRPGPVHPIRNVAVRYSRPMASRASWAGRSTLRNPVRWLLLPIHRRRDDRSFIRAAAREATALDADLVHAHDLVALRAAWRCRKPHTRLVYDAHECWTGRRQVGCPDPVGRLVDARRERRLGGAADVVLTVSDELADWLRTHRAFPDVRVIRNTAMPRDGPLPQHPQAAHYGGRIDEERDLVTAAIGTAAVEGIDLILRGIADPGVAAALARLEVEALPPITTDELADELASAGVGLVPLTGGCINHRVALPNKLFQAVQVGVPVVAADLPAIRRLVDQFHLGAVYRPGDAESFATALMEVLNNYSAYRAHVNRAKDALSWERDAALLTSIYSEVLAR